MSLSHKKNVLCTSLRSLNSISEIITILLKEGGREGEMLLDRYHQWWGE